MFLTTGDRQECLSYFVMFARRLCVEIEEEGRVKPCPQDWLDHFFMRHFTGLSGLDDTLPAGEGRLEAGLDVDLDFLHQQFEQWLRGRKLLPAAARLRITKEP